MDCLACDVEAGRITPTGGFIIETPLWTVNHALGDMPWRGWLVLQPRRHVEALYLLTPEESQELPALLSLLDNALRTSLHAEKMYVCLFAEATNCQHLHFHLIPRYAETPAKGPEIFTISPSDYPVAFIDAETTARIVAELRQNLQESLSITGAFGG